MLGLVILCFCYGLVLMCHEHLKCIIAVLKITTILVIYNTGI